MIETAEARKEGRDRRGAEGCSVRHRNLPCCMRTSASRTLPAAPQGFQGGGLELMWGPWWVAAAISRQCAPPAAPPRPLHPCRPCYLLQFVLCQMPIPWRLAPLACPCHNGGCRAVRGGGPSDSAMYVCTIPYIYSVHICWARRVLHVPCCPRLPSVAAPPPAG